MPLASDLKGLFVKANIDDAMITIIEAIGFCTILEFASMGDSDSAVNAELLDCDEMKAAKPSVIQRSRIRAAWSLCRKHVASETAGPKSAGSDDPFVDGTEDRLYKTFLTAWNRNPQGTRLMATRGLVRLYKGLQRSPRQLELMPLETIRLKSDLLVKKLEGTLLSGGEMIQVGADMQAVSSRAVAFLRMRAWASSICFIMSDVPGWYSFEANEGFVDMLFQLVFMRVDNRNPTVQAIQTAWLCTITEFATAIHLHGAKLGDLVASKHSWTHFWKDIDTFEGGARGQSSHSVSGADLDNGPLPQDVAENVNASEKLIKSLQNQLVQSKRNAASGMDATKRVRSDSDEVDADDDNRAVKRFRGGARKPRKVSLKSKRQ